MATDGTPTLSIEEDRARQVLSVSMNLLGVNDAEVAKRIGKSRSFVEGKRTGRSRIRIGEQTRAFADALGLPYDVFAMDLADAASWIFTNRFEQVIAQSRCSVPSPAFVAA